ncbi:hypothetical protein FHS00_000178 [Limimaricola variabilis]|uniref:Uncharacterized protein n=1 Tax=Limimaricola variabilis TaxID=1492771 RepID=A0ABR6HJ98_9RHOB|nr:hypothetical protein [Limimaricola variabilis]
MPSNQNQKDAPAQNRKDGQTPEPLFRDFAAI